ncbi:hypothetical protein BJ944DRAFT_251631 [Cunninghamella echinulata]|nr:hypothetical protein BJ944DRAFT_251631 [Cunninghamella echinulata]
MSYPQPNNGQYSYPPMSGVNNPSPGYYEPPRYQPTPQPQTIYIQQQQPQKKDDDCCTAFFCGLACCCCLEECCL